MSRNKKTSLLHPSPREHSRNNCFHPREFSFAPPSPLHRTPTSAPAPPSSSRICSLHGHTTLCSNTVTLILQGLRFEVFCLILHTSLAKELAWKCQVLERLHLPPAAQPGQAPCLWVSCAPETRSWILRPPLSVRSTHVRSATATMSRNGAD